MPPNIAGSLNARAALHAWWPTLVLLAALSQLLLPSHAEAALTVGLVGLWTFDGADVTDKIYDRSGQGNNGYFVGNGTPTSSAKVQGKLGQALTFDGTDDKVTMGSSALTSVDNINKSVSAWIKPSTGDGAIVDKEYDNGGSNYGGWGFWYGVGPSSGHLTWWAQPTKDLVDNGPATVPLNTWTHVAVTWNATTKTAKFYVNGVLNSTQTDATIVEQSSTLVDLSFGTIRGGESDFFAGPMDDVRVYNRELTAAEVKQLYLKGQALPNPPNNLGLVGYWSFDEGIGTKVTDFSGNGNTGTTTNTTWVNGKHGKALHFANPSSYVDAGNRQSLRLTGSYTLSTWLKEDSAADYDTISKTSASGGYFMNVNNQDVEGRNLAVCVASDSGNSGDYAFRYSTTTIRTGLWYQVTCVYDTSGPSVSVYVNGVLDNGVTTFSAGPTPSSITDSGEDLYIGERAGGVSRFDGTLDEVRVYNRALSASEIANLYNQNTAGATQVGASSQVMQQGTTLTNGLVGLWSFDGPDLTDKVYDRSGQGNNGYFTGSATSSAKVQGKLGQALDFSGGSPYVTLGSPSSLVNKTVKTISAWVYPRSITGASSNNIYNIGTNGNGDHFYFQLCNSDAGECPGAANTFVMTQFFANLAQNEWYAPANSITLNQWNHIAVVYDNSSTANVPAMYVNRSSVSPTQSFSTGVGAALDETGKEQRLGGDTGNQKLDDVRLYSRALTAAEVKQLYKLGAATIGR